MPLREGKLGHEKGDLFSCLARENLESGDHFISTQRLEDVRVLVLKFLGDCVKLLFRKWLFFRTLETSPPPKRIVDRFSHNSVNITWPSLGENISLHVYKLSSE